MDYTSFPASKLALPQDQQEKLTNDLKTSFLWQPFIDATPGNESTLSLFLAFSGILLMELRTTNFRDFVQVPMGDDLRQRVSASDADTLQQFKNALSKGVNENDWEELVAHPIVRVRLSPSVSASSDIAVEGTYPRMGQDQEAATEKSWELPFQGEAAEALWEHITHHFNPVNSKVYAHFAAIVQSSGMGKSRTVDQLSKDHFVIPLNLRDPSSTGYPPADHAVRSYLTTAASRDDAYNRTCAFLEALFELTIVELQRLQSESPEEAAAKFRKLMNDGQKMSGHNAFRSTFYETVVNRALELQGLRRKQVHETEATKSCAGFPPFESFKRLGEFLESLSAPNSSPTPGARKRNKRAKIQAKPVVILAFDEAHTLTERHSVPGGEWSVFNELQHSLRAIHNLPLFSLFLSTTGKISQFTSSMGEDLSARVINGSLILIQPFTDLGFDSLCKIIDLNGQWDLEKLTGDEYISRLGRPLFASRYTAGGSSVQEAIVMYAVRKLINSPDIPEKISDHQLLACLSQRLPIEFNSTTYIAQASERKQVEGHMRVCLKIDSAFESMTTTSASEPLLSEAAYFMMQQATFNPVTALKSVMEGFSISKGDRGEFLALLLLTLARDGTVGPADTSGRPISGKRWFSLSDFLYGQVFRVQTGASEFISKGSLQALQRLRKDFPNAHLHFNHFTKIHEHKAIDLMSLLLLQGRGAGVLCANNQAGIDAINVFLRDGTKLAQDNAGLIYEQFKNDSRYTSTPDQLLFDQMDPYCLATLKPGQPAVPLIKIVFALAAKKPYLNVVRRASHRLYKAPIYEIWCAGLSPNILGPIEPGQVGVWDALLQASYGWKDIYKSHVPGKANKLRRSTNPGAALDSGHYEKWARRT